MPGIEVPENEFDQLSRNDQFLKKLDQAIQSNLANEQFGVEQLARVMSLSRAQLYRKLHGITQKNVSQYLREYRLRKAMVMLKKDVSSASEIAYLVGFSSPSYFNKCFHEFYGITPGSVPHMDSEEDSDKIKPIYSKNLSEDEKSIDLNRIADRNRENRSDIYQDNKTHKGNTQLLPKRKISAILFILMIIIMVILMWKYIPDLFAPEELQTSKKPIIAVLPFRNDSPDQDNDYFCYQISEEIRLHLQKVHNLVVKQTIEEENYDFKGKSRITLGSELSVSHILDGSVRMVENNLRVTVFLYDAETGEQLWADSYDGVYSNEIFDFQSNVAQKICNSVNAILSRNEKVRLFARYTDSLRSYDLTVMGEYEMSQILDANSNALEPALELFDKALKIDPNNIKALVSKGKALLFTEWPERSDKLLDSVNFYCDKAIELEPEYPESYFIKAMSYNTSVRRRDRATTYFQKTIDLAPNYAEAHSRLGNIYYNNKQEYAKGLYYLSKAMELNVHADPSVYFTVSFCLMHAGFYEKAKDYLMKIITSDDLVDFDTRGMSINNYAWILIVEQKYDEALVFLDTMINYHPEYKGWCRMWQVQVPIFDGNLELAQLYLDSLTVKGVPPWQRGSVVWMYRQTDREKEATEILDDCIRIYKKRLSRNESWHNFFFLSSFYALKGEKDKAIELYTRSIDTGEDWSWEGFITSNFTFENLFDEPEFMRQVQRSKNRKAALHKQILEMQERGEINL